MTTDDFYRLYYDAWVVRNVNGPGQPGEWVKEVRTQDFNSLREAQNTGEGLTADGKYTPGRPQTYHITRCRLIEVDVTS